MTRCEAVRCPPGTSGGEHLGPEMNRKRPTDLSRMFTTRSHSWAEVGLARQLSRAAVRRARLETLLLFPAAIAVIVLYSLRKHLFPGLDVPVRVVTVVALLSIGWSLARSFGRAVGPIMFRRMDPSTAGTVGFLIRLTTMVIALLVALRIAGLGPRELTVG